MGLKIGFQKIKLDQLIPADWNYKEDEPEKIVKLVENLKRNGQVENILVRELDTGFYEVINGNHRLKAFPPANILEAMVYNFGKITPSQAKRIALETNETKFKNNTEKLSQLFKEITTDFKIDDLALSIDYKPEEINAMIQNINFDWDKYKLSIPEEKKKEKKKNTCPHCGKEL